MTGTPHDELPPAPKPPGWPIMHQTWDKLAFLHWPIEESILRPLIPIGLEIDRWDNTAWIAATPLTIRGMRPPLCPPIPLLSSTHELNLRTYVRTAGGEPGIWFFSLDAANAFAVWGARASFRLPYFHAKMRMDHQRERFELSSARVGKVPAEFRAIWHRGKRLPPAMPGTFEYFAVERYCLYTASKGYLYRSRIYHRRWPLCECKVESLQSSIISSQGLPEPKTQAIVHALAEPLEVWVWRLELIG